ncbi:MAG TPA: hypothetical protein VL048_10210 [Xanthobacteraceae bacterium]|nr:hypothetical protein [Xanthobacteraceae bacterium]
MSAAVSHLQMPNPRLWNPWLALSAQAALVAWEAQRVIALRLMRIAAGGARGRTEAQRMVTEKIAAAAEAQSAVAASVITGSSGRRTAKKVLGVYHKRVRANRRRLSR